MDVVSTSLMFNGCGVDSFDLLMDVVSTSLIFNGCGVDFCAV